MLDKAEWWKESNVDHILLSKNSNNYTLSAELIIGICMFSHTYCEVIVCFEWRFGNYSFIFKWTSLGSLDVSPHADEAGEPSYTKQRPLGAGFCPSPPGQEASPATIWNLGRQWVTANLMSHSVALLSLRQTLHPARSLTPFWRSCQGLVVFFFMGKGEQRCPLLSDCYMALCS